MRRAPSLMWPCHLQHKPLKAALRKVHSIKSSSDTSLWGRYGSFSGSLLMFNFMKPQYLSDRLREAQSLFGHRGVSIMSDWSPVSFTMREVREQSSESCLRLLKVPQLKIFVSWQQISLYLFIFVSGNRVALWGNISCIPFLLLL